MESAEIIKIAITVIVLIIAIVGHEIMHGLIAYKYGDTTAKDAGRLSINPIVHVDPIGTILVPAILYFSVGFVFGWAKPVPVDIKTVIGNGGYKAAMAVSLAGVTYNFLLAIIAAIVFVDYFPFDAMQFILSSYPQAEELNVIYHLISLDPFLYFLFVSLTLNLILGIFNSLPIPAFDGAQFLTYLSFQLGLNKIGEAFIKLARYGMLIPILVIIIINTFNIQISNPISWLLRQLLL